MLSLALAVLAPAFLLTQDQTITFETIPGVAIPADGLDISNQFDVAPYFVRFERETPSGIQPVKLARIGTPRTAFEGQTNRSCTGGSSNDDKPNLILPPGYAPGCFFLTDDGDVGGSAPDVQPLVIRYRVPVLQASGYLLDVDNAEVFQVEARDRNEMRIDTVTLNPSSVDGNAMKWMFQVTEPIHSIRITLESGSTKGIAFDDFSTASMCPSDVRHLGNGVPGSAGAVPGLSITCPVAGTPGQIDVFNGLGGAHGCLLISTNPGRGRFRCAAFPAGVEFLLGGAQPAGLQVLIPHVLSGPNGAAAEGRFTLPWGTNAIPSGLVGRTVYLQAGYCDPGSGCRGVALTEIVEATIR